ncbi:MAG: Maf family protein, partial [Pseudomonadota bacterium]
DQAKNHLRSLSGKVHTLETAILIAEDGKPVWQHLAKPKLHVRDLSESFIDRYVEACGDDLLSTVGAYKLEGRGVQIFSRIEGDFFSILGLPLLPLLDYFRSRGLLLA